MVASEVTSFKITFFRIADTSSFETNFLKIAGTSEAETSVSGKAECLLTVDKDKKSKLFGVTLSLNSI